MKFRKFFRLEAGRLAGRQKVIILVLFFLVSIYFIQSGILQYKDNLEESKRFLEFEKIRGNNFNYYGQYGTYGFRVLYQPCPLSALFNNAGIISTNLNAFIDAGERMKIYESFKGRNVFIGYTGIFLNLSGFLLLFGSLLTLYYGLDAYCNKDFIKFLVSIKGNRNIVFGFILLTRLLMVFCGVLLIGLVAGLLFLLNGLAFDV
ncbi:MAG: hypothetical protein GY765_04330, partial [bacterium]|nr:hypothetical protein [bacterium]